MAIYVDDIALLLTHMYKEIIWGMQFRKKKKTIKKISCSFSLWKASKNLSKVLNYKTWLLFHHDAIFDECIEMPLNVN